MKVFEEACRLSCEEWAATLPDSPEYTLSKKAEKRLEMTVSRMAGDRYRRVSKRAARIIAAAAIVSALLIATTAFAVMSQSDFDILGRADMSEYTVNGAGEQARSGDLQVSYVVDGFELSETYYDIDGNINCLGYVLDSETFYYVNKFGGYTTLGLDTEEYTSETMNINGINYTYYKSNDKRNNLIWNYNGYIYRVNGNIPLEESLKIAESIKY